MYKVLIIQYTLSRCVLYYLLCDKTVQIGNKNKNDCVLFWKKSTQMVPTLPDAIIKGYKRIWEENTIINKTVDQARQTLY